MFQLWSVTTTSLVFIAYCYISIRIYLILPLDCYPHLSPAPCQPAAPLGSSVDLDVNNLPQYLPPQFYVDPWGSCCLFLIHASTRVPPITSSRASCCHHGFLRRLPLLKPCSCVEKNISCRYTHCTTYPCLWLMYVAVVCTPSYLNNYLDSGVTHAPYVVIPTLLPVIYLRNPTWDPSSNLVIASDMYHNSYPSCTTVQ